MCPVPVFAQHIPITQGVRAMLMSSVKPATNSAMTDLPGRQWHKAPAMLVAPALGTPVNTLWGSSPCHNTPGHPIGSSQKSLRWARLDGTAWLPLVYDQGDCFSPRGKKTRNSVLVWAVFSPRNGVGGIIYFSVGPWSRIYLWALNATKLF